MADQDVRSVNGDKEEFTRKPDRYKDEYQGEFAALLQGYDDTFNANGDEINVGDEHNRYHLQGYFTDPMEHPCYDDTKIDIVTGEYFRAEIDDGGGSTFINRLEPDAQDFENDGEYGSTSFYVSYSPLPFFSAGVSASVKIPWEDSSTLDLDEYYHAEWDISGGDYSESQDSSTGVRFDINNSSKSKGEEIGITCKVQKDYMYNCGRTMYYQSTPKVTWGNTITMVDK